MEYLPKIHTKIMDVLKPRKYLLTADCDCWWWEGCRWLFRWELWCADGLGLTLPVIGPPGLNGEWGGRGEVDEW